MSRPRLPQDVAETMGRNVINPGRFKSRATPRVKSLGPAPKAFTPEQVEIWDEFNSDFPWLGRSDRRLVGLAVILQSEIDKGGAPVAVFAQMRMLLGALGGTPVDRTKVPAPDDEADPAEKFFA